MLNLNLKTGSRHTEQEKEKSIIINLRYNRGSVIWRENVKSRNYEAYDFEVLSFFLKEWREDRTSGISLQTFGAAFFKQS